MHILFLTWKDIKHPAKGGAEIVLYNYIIRLVAKGHKITWLSSGFSGCKKEEIIDGINIIRKFNIYTIYFFAWSWYRSFIKNNGVDLIIDEAGGIPLLSPIFLKKIPTIFFVHHIGDKEWDYKFIFPFSIIGKFFYMQLFKIYKKFHTITVSESTKEELINIGYDRNKVFVIENVLDLKPIERVDYEEKEDWVVFVGRLMPMKRVEDAIMSFHEFHCALPGYILKIIGNKQDSEYVNKLIDLTKKLGIQNQVEFLGNVSNETKNEVVRKSKALLVSSHKEGFGLVVLESNAMGTAVIGYNVPGLKDSIKDGINGELIDDGDYSLMGKRLIELVGEIDSYKQLVQKGLEHVKNLPGWDIQTNKLEKYILYVYDLSYE